MSRVSVHEISKAWEEAWLISTPSHFSLESTIGSPKFSMVAASNPARPTKILYAGGWTGSAANHIIPARAGLRMSPSSSLA